MAKTFYINLPQEEPIGQGDIFSHLPFLSLKTTLINEIIVEAAEIKYKEIDLKDYVEPNEEKNIVIPAKIRAGIIITQNCDLLRNGMVSFCEIKKYEEVEKGNTSTNETKKVTFLTKDYANKFKYFYLPAESPYGFKEKMAVDFSSIHQIKIELLESLLSKRLSRLGELPLEHFQVKIGHYFKRFAYDPWYVLNKDEFNIYKSTLNPEEIPLTKPYPWNE